MRKLEVDIPANVEPGYVIGKQGATLKALEKRLQAELRYNPKKSSKVTVLPKRDFIGEAAAVREFNIFLCQGAGKKPPSAEVCVNSNIEDDAVVRVLTVGGDHACHFDDAVTTDEPGERTEKKFLELLEKTRGDMKLGQENHLVKIQFRFGVVVFKDPVGCNNVGNLRRLLSDVRRPRYSFLTEVRLENENIFDVEPVITDIFVVSVACNNQPYFITMFRKNGISDNEGLAIDLGNDFVLVEVCVSEGILGRIDTLNASCHDIRIQIQQQELEKKGKTFDDMVRLARCISFNEKGFINIPIQGTPAGYDVFHIRRKKRCRYIFDDSDSVWDSSHVTSWDYKDGFVEKERFEIELSSKSFMDIAFCKSSTQNFDKIDWKSLLNHAWEMSGTLK